MDLRTGEPTVITRKRMTRRQKRTVLSNIALLMETEAPATEMPAAVPQMRKVGPCIPSTTSEFAERSLSLRDRKGTTPASTMRGARNSCFNPAKQGIIVEILAKLLNLIKKKNCKKMLTEERGEGSLKLDYHIHGYTESEKNQQKQEYMKSLNFFAFRLNRGNVKNHTIHSSVWKP